MGNKFISLIVTVAVCLGLVLVPLVSSAQPQPGPGAVGFWAHVPGDCSDSDVNINPDGSFDMNITIPNPDPLDLYGGEAYMEFNATLLNVTGITHGNWTGMCGRKWNDTTGWIDYTGACFFSEETGTITVNTSVSHCQVHFEATGVEGSTDIVFTASGAPDWYDTDVDGGNGVLNWSAVQNFSVNIAIPTLTVNVVGNGSVTAGGELLVMNATGYNTTTQVWEDTVSLVATADTGWKFTSWAGVDGPADVNESWVNITDPTQLVTLTFEEKAPDLWVNKTNVVFTGARIEIDPDDEALLVKNTGGQHLNWRVGSPPEWWEGDSWVWNNSYGLAGNLVTMEVVDNTSDPDNYICFANFSPPAIRYLDAFGHSLEMKMFNATVWVDKYSLDSVKQVANLAVNQSSVWYPATATVEWEFFGDHGWPYSMGKNWAYNVSVLLLCPTHPIEAFRIIPLNTTQALASVTNFTNYTSPLLPGSPTFLGIQCYEVTHTNLTYYPGKWTYWPADDPYPYENMFRNTWVTIDGGTYVYPPPDIRMLWAAMTDVNAPDPIVQPDWLTISPMNSSLGIEGTEAVTLSANVTYPDVLTEQTYTGNFTITAPGCILNKTIEVVMDVKGGTTVMVERNLPGTNELPNCTYTGDTFDVYVNFTASRNNFSAIGITDLAPPGWEVAVNKSWCSANGDPADRVKATGNKAEIAWYGEAGVGYPKNTEFVAKYQVTVPGTAVAGLHQFVWDDGSQAWAEYWFGPEGPFTSNVTGERNMTITVWGDVVGETRDVNANLLPNVDVNLRWMNLTANYPGAWRDNDESNPNFALTAKKTGIYYLQGSKDRYNPLDTYGMNPWSKSIDFSTPKLLEAGNKTDFEGDFGLVPMACNMSYAMESINHYLFTPIDDLLVPHPEWKITFLQKALESIYSWQNPS